MKNYILLPLMALSLFWYSDVSANKQIKLKTDTFTVYGNCDMCKSKIEKSVKALEGVSAVVWNVKTKVLTVVYNPSVTGLKAIHQTISKLGYKTSELPADQSRYDKLPYCCQVPDAFKSPKTQ